MLKQNALMLKKKEPNTETSARSRYRVLGAEDLTGGALCLVASVDVGIVNSGLGRTSVDRTLDVDGRT
jgi:hypothetical protein